MSRLVFFLISLFLLALVVLLGTEWPHMLYALVVLVPVIILGCCNLFSAHNLLRNYPVIGYLRYLFEFIRPEIQQYFVATNLSGRPYSREQRSLIYQRAKNAMDTHPFGTEHDITQPGYYFANHSLNVKRVNSDAMRVTIGGPACLQPYSASLVNISAMSFGALSKTAVLAFNLGAKLADIYQNTGEGGITEYHLKEGGALVWQIGTGYFGCRDLNGDFDPDEFKKKSQLSAVKMIEIKLSQGAKPSHGGLLPADKITPEIAKIRGIPIAKDCLSPPDHQTFSTPVGLLEFVQQLRDLSGGKPVGFKLALGIKREFMAICKAMMQTGITPDFITVDGAEGGTGAAPLVFSNRLGVPGDEAVAFVHNSLVGCGLRDKVRIIASAKITTSFDIIRKIALGADLVNMARPFMFSIGCIQAIRCNENTCPTGVTSNMPRRYKAIVPKEKAQRVKNFHHNTINSLCELSGAMGFTHPHEVTPDRIYVRTDKGCAKRFTDEYHFIEKDAFLTDIIPEYYKHDWLSASADSF